MRLRNQLLITWGGLAVLLWAGTLWPIRQTIASNFAHVAGEAFAGTRRGLEAIQAERQERMRQACRLLMNIPELRALIAEDAFEISEDNVASLTERLDDLDEIVGASFVCVLDGQGGLVAQNQGSPWPTLDAAFEYLRAGTQ